MYIDMCMHVKGHVQVYVHVYCELYTVPLPPAPWYCYIEIKYDMFQKREEKREKRRRKGEEIRIGSWEFGIGSELGVGNWIRNKVRNGEV